VGSVTANRVANVGVRLIVSLLPLAMLAVTKVIIDSIYNYTANHTPLPAYFWWLVISEFALACISTILVRVTDYCDTVLADKYAKYVSIRIMQHASRLDLTSYEDPTFQDKLERAAYKHGPRADDSSCRTFDPANCDDRQPGIQHLPLFAVVTFCIDRLRGSRILGETHFAFLGYSLSFAQTPARREMEYLRVLGGSKESAKN